MCFISIVFRLHAKFQKKILTIALVIAKFRVKWGGVKLDTAMLIYRHWAIIVHSEKLLNIIALMKYEDYHKKC